MPPSRFVPLGDVLRPHGITGELRVRLHNEESDLLLHLPSLVLRDEKGAERRVRVASARRSNKALLLRIEGGATRNDADLLRGASLGLPREELPPPDEDEVYLCDLEGASVRDGDTEIGRVSEIRPYPTCHVLVVERPNATALDIPFLPMFVRSVDVEQGVIQVMDLEQLL